MDAKEQIKILKYLGFAFERQGGKASHEEWGNGEVTVTVVSGHSGDIPNGTVYQSFKDAGAPYLNGVKSFKEAQGRIDAYEEEEAERLAHEAAENTTIDFAAMGMTPDQIALFQQIPDSMDGISISNDGVSEDLEILSLSKQFFTEAEDDSERQGAVNTFIQEYYAIDKEALASLTKAVHNISQFISEEPAAEGSLTAAQREAAADSGQTINVDKADLEVTSGQSCEHQSRAGRNNRRNNR